MRVQATTPRPSPVLPDRMNQPAQHVDVDVVEPARRETHHMLLFMITATAAGTRAHGEAEDPVLFLWVTSHGFAPRCLL